MRDDARPKYFLIKEKIKSQIEDSTYPPGSLLPSQNDFIKMEKVSYSTIAHALDELRKDGLICRISGKGTFVQPMEKRKSKKLKIKVGFYTDNSPVYLNYENNINVTDILLGISDACHSAGHTMESVYYSNPNDLEELIEPDCAFFLFNNDVNKLLVAEKLKKQNIPYIIHSHINCISQGINALFVNVQEGMASATNALIKAGHKKIAFIHALTDEPWSNPKFWGFREALASHEIEFNEKFLFRSSGNCPIMEKEADSFIRESLKSGVTAVLAVNDMRALGVINVARKLGVKIPDDLALIGYDDIPLAGAGSPSLTTMSFPRREIGKCAVHLFSLMREIPEICPFIKVFESRMIIRESFIP